MSTTVEATHAPLTVDDFLDFLDRKPRGEKWQLFDGVPVAMIGGTRRHSLICGNVYRAIHPMARRRGCEAHMSDMLVTSPSNDRFAGAPDVFVRCGPVSNTTRKIFDPTLIVEILSPSTMADDRGYKFKLYTSIPSLQQIVFIYQDEPRVESWVRQAGEWVLITSNGLEGTILLPPLADEISIAGIYEATA